MIVVCDGVVDYENDDKRIKIYETEPTNQNGNYQRVVGIKKAKNDYILFLDDDDFLTENALVEVKSSLEKHGFPDILIAKTYGQYGYMPHEPFTRPLAGSIGGGNVIIKSTLAKKVQWPYPKNGTWMDNKYCDFKFINACWYIAKSTAYDPDVLIGIIPKYSLGV